MVSLNFMSQPRIVESTLEFPYSRSLGPVVGEFLAGLKQHRILGIRAADGKVLVPPLEYDPNTGDTLSELVEVGPQGTVGSWTWVDEPTPKHPLDRPFAFALVTPPTAPTPRWSTRSTRAASTRCRRACACSPAGAPKHTT